MATSLYAFVWKAVFSVVMDTTEPGMPRIVPTPTVSFRRISPLSLYNCKLCVIFFTFCCVIFFTFCCVIFFTFCCVIFFTFCCVIFFTFCCVVFFTFCCVIFFTFRCVIFFTFCCVIFFTFCRVIFFTFCCVIFFQASSTVTHRKSLKKLPWRWLRMVSMQAVTMPICQRTNGPVLIRCGSKVTFRFVGWTMMSCFNFDFVFKYICLYINTKNYWK